MDYLYLYLRRPRAGRWRSTCAATAALQREHAQELKQSLEAGLAEPPSLHPVIDPSRCIGSGSCARACPEEALGVVDGKAVLINGSACIGHGACLAACPVEAITLVFGTEKRGIDIPHVSPEFETNVPGIYIAGELGGMGLIRKAAEQGRQAMDAIRKRAGGSHDLDVVIVGCGPAGLSAGLAAIQHKLRYRIIEQEDSLGGAVYHYPRNKIAMTAPVQLALVGKVKFGEVSKEQLLEFWQGVVQRHRAADVASASGWTASSASGDGFVVQTDQRHATARARCCWRWAGAARRASSTCRARKPSKVVYRLVDAEQYRGQARAGGRRRRQRARGGDRAGRAAGHRRSRCPTAARPSRASRRRTASGSRQLRDGRAAAR